MVKRLGVLALCVLLCPSAVFAAAQFTLGKNQSQIVKAGGKSLLCGFVGNKWQPVSKIGGKFFRKNTGASAAHKKACSGLLKKGSFNSLAKLPGISQIARTKYLSRSMAAFEFSGTPPVLTDIVNMGIGTLFWRSGIFDGFQTQNPTPEQCSEFWIGAADGLSGGFLSCTMAEDVGYAFEPILRSGSSLCYMQNVASDAVGTSGALTVVSGSLPDGGVSKLFSVPSGNSPRTVRINTSGQGGHDRKIFIKIQPSVANSVDGFQYRAKLWFCGKRNPSDAEGVISTENISVLLSGVLKTESIGSDNYGGYSASTQGMLKAAAAGINFDTSTDRTANIFYRSISDQNRFNTQMTIGANGTITQKFFNEYGGRTSKRLTISRVGGESLQDLRFYEGAFSELSGTDEASFESHSGAVEFRDSVYLSAPQSSLLKAVQKYSFENDSFFDSLADVGSVDATLSCDADVDVELDLDMTNSVMQTIVAQCETNNRQTSNFCRENDVIKAVLDNFQEWCAAPA